MNRIKKALGVSGLGISLDWLTTHIGINVLKVAYETHPMASPITALAIFGGASLLLHKILPKRKLFDWSLILFNILSWAGFINNTIVILQAI